MAAPKGTTLRNRRAKGAVPGGTHGPASGGDGEDRTKTSSVDGGYGDNRLGRDGRRTGGRRQPRRGPGGTITAAPARAVARPFPACQARLVDDAPGLGGAGGPVRLVCSSGWALAERGSLGAAVTTLELFKATASGWAEQATGNGSEIDYAPESLGVPLAVLVRLGADLGPETRPDIGAATLVHNASERTPGGSGGPVPWAASAVVHNGGGEWLAAGYSPGASGPGIVLSIYRWGRGAWAAPGWTGSDAKRATGRRRVGHGSIAHQVDGPDFVVSSFGADTNWLSVVSDAGGTWHAVPFDYGYGPTIAIDAAGVHGHLVETETDGCGCAAGPETYTWEIYAGGTFHPTAPPGPAPTCGPDALASAADPAGLLDLAFTRASCADGWALGTGTAPGYANGFVGLFEQQRNGWQPVNIDDGAALGRDPLIYDIPLTLLDRIGSALGPQVARSVAGGAVYRSLDAGGSSTLWTVSGGDPFPGQELAAGCRATGPRGQHAQHQRVPVVRDNLVRTGSSPSCTGRREPRRDGAVVRGSPNNGLVGADVCPPWRLPELVRQGLLGRKDLACDILTSRLLVLGSRLRAGTALAHSCPRTTAAGVAAAARPGMAAARFANSSAARATKEWPAPRPAPG